MSTRQDFKYEIGQQVDIGRFHGVITNRYRNNGKRYKYTCVNCGYEGDKLESAIDKGQGCPCCYGKVVKVGFNDITTTAPWMIPYFQGGPEEASKYTSNSHKQIYPRCPYCGKVREYQISIGTIYADKGFACECKDNISIPNKIIFDLMKQLKEKELITYYQREFMFEDSSYRYDMYFEINNDKYLVEMDGAMHSYVIRKHKFAFVPVRSLVRDREKDEIASGHDIPIFRIDCYHTDIEYIKNKLEESGLSKIIDLSVIDWKRISEFAYGNIIYDVCAYKDSHNDATTLEIGNVFNLHQSTVLKYLKRGNELGWCHYEPKEEWYKVHENMGFSNFIHNEVIDLLTGNKYVFQSLSHIFKNNEINRIDKSSDYKTLLKMIKEKDGFIENYKNYQIKKIDVEEYYKYIKEK